MYNIYAKACYTPQEDVNYVQFSLLPVCFPSCPLRILRHQLSEIGISALSKVMDPITMNIMDRNTRRIRRWRAGLCERESEGKLISTSWIETLLSTSRAGEVGAAGAFRGILVVG